MFAPIQRKLRPILHRFCGDQRGNIAILAAVLSMPMLAISGAALDYSRAVNARSHLANALDSALLALAKAPAMENPAASSFVKNYVTDMLSTNGQSLNWQMNGLSQPGRMITASVKADVGTALLGIMKIDNIKVEVKSEVTRDNKAIEAVLVLDNTGSMYHNGKIAALRSATNQMLDILFESNGAKEMVKVGMVPFVTSVNIKAQGFKTAWIDKNGESRNNGINFDPTTGPTNHYALFATMKGVEWKGCVEARPAPYDVQDTVPHPGKKDTLWVPYLWPDEPDTSNNYSNNYLADGVSGTFEERQRNAKKYAGSTPWIDEVPSSTRGPNKACPQPLRPLTNDVAVLKADADKMTPWFNSGTNIAVGLGWGWRVLSPEAPFTEGTGYDDEEVEKALILLTDGRNEVVSQSTHNKSDYNGYGYINAGVLGASSTWEGVSKVNTKVETLCNAIKAKGIRIYTITFQLNDNALKKIFSKCATSPAQYFDSPSNQELKNSFRAIALDLSDLRLSK